jgi:hypothetical protein
MKKHLGPCEALNITHAFGYEPGERCGDDGHTQVEDGDFPRTVCFTHAAVARDRTHELTFKPVDLHGMGERRRAATG